jgi:5-methylthioadenosine/S-adenosylhomocysteine deaminase
MPAPRGRDSREETVSDHPARAWTTLYRAAWVLPISGEPISDGAVLVEGDRIAWVGARAAMPAAPQARVVELGDALLTPGLVNAHTHLDLTALRGLLHGESFFSWIRSVVAARDELTADETLDSARAGILEGLLAGVTTFADTAPGPAGFRAIRDMAVRGIAYLEVFGPDPAQCDAALADLRHRVAALRPGETPLVRVGVSPHAPYSVSDVLYAATADFARREGLPLATHVAESDAELSFVAAGTGPFAELLGKRGIAVAPRGRTPVAMLERAGVLAANALLIHCVRCDAGDVAAIARSGAAVVTCPNSNRYFGHGAAPAREFVAAGVRLGVGSDSMASNTRMDLLAEARAATEAGHAATGETPEGRREQWELATIGGARALGLGDAIGTLEVGKQADLAAFAIPGDAAQGRGAVPVLAAGSQAQLVVVAGAERVCAGRLAGDAAGIAARASAVTARLREWRARARGA